MEKIKQRLQCCKGYVSLSNEECEKLLRALEGYKLALRECDDRILTLETEVARYERKGVLDDDWVPGDD